MCRKVNKENDRLELLYVMERKKIRKLHTREEIMDMKMEQLTSAMERMAKAMDEIAQQTSSENL